MISNAGFDGWTTFSHIFNKTTNSMLKWIWSLKCRSCAIDYSLKLCYIFDARHGVKKRCRNSIKKRCQTWHRLFISGTTRCHVWHRFLTPCLASKSCQTLYLSVITYPTSAFYPSYIHQTPHECSHLLLRWLLLVEEQWSTSLHIASITIHTAGQPLLQWSDCGHNVFELFYTKHGIKKHC